MACRQHCKYPRLVRGEFTAMIDFNLSCLFGHKWDMPNAECVRCGARNPKLKEAREQWENRDTEALSEEDFNRIFKDE